MKKFLSISFSVFAFSSLSAQFNGTWNGTLDLRGFKLPIVFHITQTNGQCSATFDSPMQEVFDVPVTETVCKTDSVFLYMKNINAAYEGKRVGTDKITGIFTQHETEFPLELNAGEYVEEKPALRPQEPKAPFPYVVKEVSIPNKLHEITLSGTLTLPDTATAGKYPVVVLITGSGAQNRDEELLGHKPFIVIADYLTRKGVAVLRCDDRGVGKSTGNFAEATSVDFSYDVEACVTWLQKQPYINKKQIGLIGHSEGGMIAPMVAARNKNVAFIVLLAGTGVNGEDIIVKQTELIGTAEGEGDAKKSAEVNRKLIQALKSSRDPNVSAKAMRKVFQEEFKKLTPEELAEYADTASYINQNIMQLNTHWFRYFVEYNPAETMQKVKCPVLILNGEKDLQVDADQNIPPLEAALKKGKNKKYKIVRYKNLNHLFQHTETGKISEYSTIEETFAEEVLSEMYKWIYETIR